MYGTYAAKAFLNANVAPLTYVRLLGVQHTNATSDGEAGWKTTRNANADVASNGGAYGMWIIPSGTAETLDSGSLAAVWYVDSGSSILLSGALRGGAVGSDTEWRYQGIGMPIGSDANGVYTVTISGSDGSSEKVQFSFDDDSEYFIRKRFNFFDEIGDFRVQ